MRYSVLSFAVAFVLATAACGGDRSDPAADNTEDELRRAKPIAQVAQYVGVFEALDVKHGDFELKDDGTFVWHQGEQNYYEAGNYRGPSQPTTEAGFTLKLTTRRFGFEITDGQWTAAQGAPAMLTIKLENGESVDFQSKYRLAAEAECQETGGRYTDDDLDPATGLNCVCAAPKKWRHASGGCH